MINAFVEGEGSDRQLQYFLALQFKILSHEQVDMNI